MPANADEVGQVLQDSVHTNYAVLERPSVPGDKEVILQYGSGDILLLPSQQQLEESGAGSSGQPCRVRPRIALALGGGGTRGAAHIGVLRVLQQEKIPIDMIVGTSMGAVIGGLYAAGIPLNVIEEIAVSGQLRKAYAPGAISGHVLAMIFSRIRHPIEGKNPPGLYSGEKFQEYLEGLIPAQYQYIENLPLPFSAVAMDMMSGKVRRITTGPLAEAIRASSSLPPAVRPLEKDDVMLVDGGLAFNLPTFTAKELGADIVISVDVDEHMRPVERETLYKSKEYANRTASIVLDATDEKARNMSDFVIWPEVNGIDVFSRKTEDMQRAILLGEQEARKDLAEIRRVISGEYQNERSASLNRGLR